MCGGLKRTQIGYAVATAAYLADARVIEKLLLLLLIFKSDVFSNVKTTSFAKWVFTWTFWKRKENILCEYRTVDSGNGGDDDPTQ